MTDNRKVLEQTPSAANLSPTPPTAGESASDGANIGGITGTADSAIRNDDAASGQQPVVGPKNDAPTGKPAAAGARPSPPSRSAGAPAKDAATRADEQSPDDESALESLGRAIGAPLSGEAAEDEPRR